MAKKMIIKGVGTMMAKKYSADGKGVEVITLGTLQNLRFDFNVEIDDIFGGDGLFAIDTLIRSKSIEISATDAKFDLDQMQLMLGSTVQEQASTSLWVIGEQDSAVSGVLDPTATPSTVACAEVAVEFGDSLFGGGNFAVRLKNSNKLLTKATLSLTVAPDTDEYYIQTVTTPAPSTRIILNSAHAGADIVFNYQREAEDVDVVDLIADEVPFPVHIIHHGSFLQKDGQYAGIETELFSCIAQGQFSIDAQRAAASTSSVTLRVIDPERADGKLGSIKRYSAAKRV
ncbi:MAG: hypothetical protein J7559_12325 [Cohnella sp.]|nr:hypothetical protein [Cohnella sp.]